MQTGDDRKKPIRKRVLDHVRTLEPVTNDLFQGQEANRWCPTRIPLGTGYRFDISDTGASSGNRAGTSWSREQDFQTYLAEPGQDFSHALSTLPEGPASSAFYFHGTTLQSALFLVQHGISLEVSVDESDFGSGFYLAVNLQDTVDFAR